MNLSAYFNQLFEHFERIEKGGFGSIYLVGSALEDGNVSLLALGLSSALRTMAHAEWSMTTELSWLEERLEAATRSRRRRLQEVLIVNKRLLDDTASLLKECLWALPDEISEDILRRHPELGT
ncbi:hypothetical protein [Deinococcus pimensis]|uniref:hypothetical protein n=1 Tax=Deinococcus pimensis TaxID=309888 RepID=UPI00146FB478|nr:hypothetical protein [Deinococcus pimensis]